MGHPIGSAKQSGPRAAPGIQGRTGCLEFLHSGCNIEAPVCAASSQLLYLYRRRIKHGPTSSYSHCPLETICYKAPWANFPAGSIVFVPSLPKSWPTLQQRSLFCISELSHGAESVSFVSVLCQAPHQLLGRCLHAPNLPSLSYHNPWVSSTASRSTLGKFRSRLEFGLC